MQTLLPPWPQNLPRHFSDRAILKHPPLSADQLAVAHAQRRARERQVARCSSFTGTWSELLFVNTADYSAFASSASEGTLLSGVNEQPTIPALFFFNKPGQYRALSLVAQGVLSTTSTPTIIFQVRASSTAGSSTLSGTSLGVSPTITTQSGVTNKYWRLQLDLACRTPGTGTGNTTISGAGFVTSPGGFASPFIYPLEPTTPDTATWTATLDNSLTYYLNLSVTWSSSSSSNTITLKQLWLAGLN